MVCVGGGEKKTNGDGELFVFPLLLGSGRAEKDSNGVYPVFVTPIGESFGLGPASAGEAVAEGVWRVVVAAEPGAAAGVEAEGKLKVKADCLSMRFSF